MSRALFLHGVPTDGGLRDGVLARLKIDSEAPDLAGFGHAPPLESPTVDALVAPLLDRVDADTHLVGHDLGGLLAAQIASLRPVRSVTLCSTALGLGWLPSRMTALWPANLYFYRRFGGRRWLAMGVSAPSVDALLARFPGAEPARMEAIARRLPLWTPRFKAPTLCLWGAQDRSFPAVFGRVLASRLGAEFVALPGLRHYAMWEGPAPFAEALEAFWAGARA